jgi:phosphoglucosamine mutase
VSIGTEPNGLNINDACGAVSPKSLRVAVIDHQADVGVAIDGDGDRLIMVDSHGDVVDGDELLYIVANARHREGTLGGGVVGTLMTNFGLEQALTSLKIPFKRAAVGDRYVLEILQQAGWKLGGESSGHIICLDRTTTGDAIISALQVLHVLVSTGQGLHEIKAGMTKYPQILVNVPIGVPIDIGASEIVQRAVADAERELADRGRVLLRPSGTEPLVRVMVEGQEPIRVKQLAERIAEQVREAASSGNLAKVASHTA